MKHEAYFLEIKVQYIEKLHGLPFSPKIKNIDKVRKPAAKLRDENNRLYI